MVNKKIISLDIGNEKIKIVKGRNCKNNIFIENAISIDTPKNSIIDGNIINIDLLSSYMKENLYKNDLKGNRGIITLDYSSIITREINLPYVKEEELKRMIKYEIEQLIPINIDDYVIDYKKREEFIENNIKKLRLLVIVMSKKAIKDYIKLLKNIKLKSYSLDLNSNAISKLISRNLRINGKEVKSNETIVFLDIGYRNININIISNYISDFNRIIECGSRDIDTKIANYFNIKLSEAKLIKEEFDFEKNNTNSFNGVSNIIIDILDDWISQIDRIFSYYKKLSITNRIDEIYVYGGGSKLKDLDKYFKNEFNIKTYILKDISPLKKGKKVKNIDLTKYLNNIGAMIRF
ncbi:type IV pilus assembly protein PilM [Clostridium sp. D2Q-14]|uniref:type IV pilus assembly protein PilM n=1 Tax=Anaeromonas gelatinilytica TaxID=2683194 RepID=UPI00193B257F|nr:type IV pilus assembly protein PilM [Anaeromonas gelatinilytica]MBS4536187.1 type IV pilus assembly protein PilM [Anaeromonas gelatinilytica]